MKADEHYADKRAEMTFNTEPHLHPTIKSASIVIDALVKRRLKTAGVEYTRKGMDFYVHPKDAERVTEILGKPLNTKPRRRG